MTVDTNGSNGKMGGEIVMYGATWCPDCRRAKQFFGEHRVRFSYIDIDENPAAIATIEAINDGLRSIPTIVFPDGSTLVEPSNAELAEKMGLQTEAMREFYDIVIVGGGPTGLSAAIYASREGLHTLVIEKSALGGQAGVTNVLDNFPGFDEGISGEEFARRLKNQAARFGAELLEATAVDHITRDEAGYLCIHPKGRPEIGANAALIATGSRYRMLDVPGEMELIGVNIHFCATCDGAFYKGKDVLVIGGGNSGFEEGLYLTRFAGRVRIMDNHPKPKASAILQEKVAARDDMEVITNHTVQSFQIEDGRLVGVVAKNLATGEEVVWHPDGVFVFIGLSPNVDVAPDEVGRSGRGFIETDATLMTAMPGLFAAGDVRAGSTKQAAAAAGEGVTAALMMRQYLEKHMLVHKHEVEMVEM
jgi:thioredoxin reductase (NADPH)